MPDGEKFAVYSDPTSELSICDANNETLHTWTTGPEMPPFFDLDISSNGQRLVMVSYDRLIIFDLATRARVGEYLPGKEALTWMCASKSSHHILVAVSDHTVRLIDLDSLEVMKTYTGGQFIMRCILGGVNEHYVVSGSRGISSSFCPSHHPAYIQLTLRQTSVYTSGEKRTESLWRCWQLTKTSFLSTAFTGTQKTPRSSHLLVTTEF